MEGMMRGLIKKILPQFVEEKVKDILQQPSLYYMRRTVQTYREWLFKSYSPKYQVDEAPLMKSFCQYESLFESSADNFKEIVTQYVSEFRWSVGRIYNGSFVSIDPELYYSVIRHYRPGLIIEVGSGHSTHFAADALRMNRGGRIISIDPEPRTSLPQTVNHMRAKVEDVSTDMFADLQENDILFIDSSHTAEEAHYHCRQILPRLGKGAIIHHHDFTFPYEIYYGDDPLVFGEPDVLLDFYAANRDAFEVLVCASYVRFLAPQLVRRLITSYRWNPRRIPGSLWVRKQE
jgi:hypothetical protein